MQNLSILLMDGLPVHIVSLHYLIRLLRVDIYVISSIRLPEGGLQYLWPLPVHLSVGYMPRDEIAGPEELGPSFLDTWNLTLWLASALGHLGVFQGEVSSGSLLELFLPPPFHGFCYCNHTERPASENPASLPDSQTEVPLFRTLATCRWQEGTNTSPCLRLAVLDVCKISGLFTVPSPPHLPPNRISDPYENLASRLC